MAFELTERAAAWIVAITTALGIVWKGVSMMVNLRKDIDANRRDLETMKKEIDDVEDELHASLTDIRKDLRNTADKDDVLRLHDKLDRIVERM